MGLSIQAAQINNVTALVKAVPAMPVVPAWAPVETVAQVESNTLLVSPSHSDHYDV